MGKTSTGVSLRKIHVKSWGPGQPWHSATHAKSHRAHAEPAWSIHRARRPTGVIRSRETRNPLATVCSEVPETTGWLSEIRDLSQSLVMEVPAATVTQVFNFSQWPWMPSNLLLPKGSLFWPRFWSPDYA